MNVCIWLSGKIPVATIIFIFDIGCACASLDLHFYFLHKKHRTQLETHIVDGY